MTSSILKESLHFKHGALGGIGLRAVGLIS
jgi:hypothetical protein